MPLAPAALTALTLAAWGLALTASARAGEDAIATVAGRPREVTVSSAITPMSGGQGTMDEEPQALPSAAISDPSDGRWIEIPFPAVDGGSAVYDPVRHRMIVFGGYLNRSHEEVWACELGAEPAWRRLETTGPAPTSRWRHSAIYDPVRDRMIVFGGLHETSTLLNDVWTLSLSGEPEWIPLSPAGPVPLPREAHTAIYDPVRDRMVVFGGYVAGATNETWSLSLAGAPTWSLLTTAGTPPTPRAFHASAYDATRDRMIVFGRGTVTAELNDAHALSLSGTPQWSPIATTGTAPPGRSRHTVIVDPIGDRLVVFGGTGGTGNDTWTLSLADAHWMPLATLGTTPAARSEHAAIYDPVARRMLTAGGTGDRGLRELWSLSLQSSVWSLAAEAPQVGETQATVYDSKRDRLIAFRTVPFGDVPEVVWELRLGDPPRWSRLMTLGTPPPGGTESMAGPTYSASYDPRRDRVVLFSGSVDGGLWSLELSGTPTWVAMTTTNPFPYRLQLPICTYDPVRDRLLVMMGRWIQCSCGNGNCSIQRTGRMVALPLTAPYTWEAAGGTPGLTSSAVVYDGTRDRLLAIGGRAVGSSCDFHDPGFNQLYNNVWQMDPSGLVSDLSATGTGPAPLDGHSAAYDATRDRALVFGPGPSDVWELSLETGATWRRMLPDGHGPDRPGGQSFYLPGRDAMVLFEGTDGDARLLQWADPVLVVRVDVKPGNPQNTVPVLGSGVCPIAFLSDVGFDATEVDPASVRGGGATVSVGARGDGVIRDVDGDGLVDWVAHVVVTTLGVEETTAVLRLDARTRAGRDLRGYDRVRVVPRGARVLDPSPSPELDEAGNDKDEMIFALDPVQPNPAESRATIRFSTPALETVRLRIFDVAGRAVRTLVDGPVTAGTHRVVWDRRTGDGTVVAAGIYHVQLVGGERQASRRLLLIR